MEQVFAGMSEQANRCQGGLTHLKQGYAPEIRVRRVFFAHVNNRATASSRPVRPRLQPKSNSANTFVRGVRKKSSCLECAGRWILCCLAFSERYARRRRPVRRVQFAFTCAGRLVAGYAAGVARIDASLAKAVSRRQAGIDVLAWLAIGLAIELDEMITVAVIALKLASGRTLERYA